MGSYTLTKVNFPVALLYTTLLVPFDQYMMSKHLYARKCNNPA